MNKTTKYLLSFACLAIMITTSCKKEKPKIAPTVTTAALTSITTTGATGGGTITSDGGSAITASGIVLSRGNSTPTLSDTVITSTVATGSFTANITNLEFNRTYYIRAYATNAIGTSYGNVVTLNTTNDDTKVRFIYRGQEVVYGIIVSPTTGKKWLDRNLGANQVATSSTDAQAYGDLFQWGRLADGHQLRTADTTWAQSSIDVPGHNKLIRVQGKQYQDWRNPQNPNLWQGTSGTNNPCPTGWHVPTQSEWDAETGITNNSSAFSLLKLPAAGEKWEDTKLYDVGSAGYYWTSTTQAVVGGLGRSFYTWFASSNNSYSTSADSRGQAMSVRCIKD